MAYYEVLQYALNCTLKGHLPKKKIKHAMPQTSLFIGFNALHEIIFTLYGTDGKVKYKWGSQNDPMCISGAYASTLFSKRSVHENHPNFLRSLGHQPQPRVNFAPKTIWQILHDPGSPGELGKINVHFFLEKSVHVWISSDTLELNVNKPMVKSVQGQTVQWKGEMSVLRIHSIDLLMSKEDCVISSDLLSSLDFGFGVLKLNWTLLDIFGRYSMIL